jgi:addiction module HigA family antidote
MHQARRPIAIHPGEILREEFLKPLGLSQRQLADALLVPVQRVNLLVNGKRGVTVELAYRLARYFGTSAELWMGLQQDWDIRSARDAGIERVIARITPMKRSA